MGGHKAGKLGIIAGGGDLPVALVHAARDQKRPYTLIVLTGFFDQGHCIRPDFEFRLGDIGKMLKMLKAENITDVCFAGYVSRPDFSSFRPDRGGLKYLPGAIKAAAKGDDALLRYAAKIFEDNGMRLIAPQDVLESHLIAEGALGRIGADDAIKADIDKAVDIARLIGGADIGQGAVVCNGVVLAVEAQEGTDAMLARIAELPENVRGNSKKRRGVLAKVLKPHQDRRLDLPTIGPATIEGADKAGLAAIVMIAGQGFVMDRETVASKANTAGIAVIGLAGTPK